DLLFVHLFSLELDRRLLQDPIVGEDRGLSPDGERDRVGRARVDFDLVSVLLNGDRGEEGVVAQLGHAYARDLRGELTERVREGAVRERSRSGRALELHQDRRRLGVPDPDGQELVPVRRLEQDDRLLADEIEAHAVDDHLLHLARFPEAESSWVASPARGYT